MVRQARVRASELPRGLRKGRCSRPRPAVCSTAVTAKGGCCPCSSSAAAMSWVEGTASLRTIVGT